MNSGLDRLAAQLHEAAISAGQVAEEREHFDQETDLGSVSHAPDRGRIGAGSAPGQARQSRIMNQLGGLACQASVSPADAECSRVGCGQTVTVRLVLRHGDSAYDYCDLDWPHVTKTLRARGLEVTDTTGNIWTVRAEFPHWEIWQSGSSGIYYALTSFGGVGVSVHAFLVGTLRAGMLAAEQARASEVKADEASEALATGLMEPQPHPVAGVVHHEQDSHGAVAWPRRVPPGAVERSAGHTGHTTQHAVHRVAGTGVAAPGEQDTAPGLVETVRASRQPRHPGRAEGRTGQALPG